MKGGLESSSPCTLGAICKEKEKKENKSGLSYPTSSYTRRQESVFPWGDAAMVMILYLYYTTQRAANTAVT